MNEIMCIVLFINKTNIYENVNNFSLLEYIPQ